MGCTCNCLHGLPVKFYFSVFSEYFKRIYYGYRIPFLCWWLHIYVFFLLVLSCLWKSKREILHYVVYLVHSLPHIRALFSPCDFGVHQALLPHTSRGNAILLIQLLLLVLEYQELLLHVVFMKHLLRCHVIIVRFHLYLFYLFSLIRSRKYLLLLSTLAYSYHLVRWLYWSQGIG